MDNIITVVMPVYNAEDNIDMSIQSVLNQNNPNWYLILVDDGSRDSSGTKCDFYAANDNRISVIHKKNQGAMAARRDGFYEAKTDFCISLDADDMLHPDCIEKITEAIKKYEADIVLYSFCGVSGEKITLDIPPLREVSGIIEKKCVQKQLLSTNDYNSMWTKAIRTEYLKSDPLYHEDINLSIGEDKVQFLYPLTRANRIAVIPDVLYFYKKVEGSMTHSYTAEKVIDRMGIEMIDHLYFYMKKWDLVSLDDMEAMSTMFWRSVVGIYNILQGNNVRKNDYDRICKYNFRNAVPSYIISFVKCPAISFKDKIKIWLLIYQHHTIMRLLR